MQRPEMKSMPCLNQAVQRERAGLAVGWSCSLRLGHRLNLGELVTGFVQPLLGIANPAHPFGNEGTVRLLPSRVVLVVVADKVVALFAVAVEKRDCLVCECDDCHGVDTRAVR